jgi:hypothetical protein
MMINLLQKLLRPQESAAAVGTLEAWRSVESRFKLTFPTDYREFCFHYGVGHIRDSSIVIDVLNPFSEWFESGISELLESARRLSEELDPRRYQKFDVHPCEPGLFPWGMDDLGNEFFWYTSGDPDDWKVIVHDRGLIEFVATEYGMCEFLVRCMDRSATVGPYTQDGFFPDRGGIVFIGKEYSGEVGT